MNLVVQLKKQFPGFDFQVEFSLHSRRCGIFGPSGSGKSTLMNMLAGLIPPDSGSIHLNGQTVFDSREKVDVPANQRRVGVVFQHSHLFPHMNVKNNMLYGWKRTVEQERMDPDGVIEMLELGSLLDRRVQRLSGGERQRVALARTILASPRLILMDEPLTGLDTVLKYDIIPQLQRVFEEYSIPMLFISHSFKEMRLMTDDLLVFERGRLAAHLPTEKLARKQSSEGYTNLLDLKEPRDLGDLMGYRWGDLELRLLKQPEQQPKRFELNSRDILLFKKNPEATSARNMLECTVKNVRYGTWLVEVELECSGNTLVAEVVPQSIEELGILPGSSLIAVIKASAFHPLC